MCLLSRAGSCFPPGQHENISCLRLEQDQAQSDLSRTLGISLCGLRPSRALWHLWRPLPQRPQHLSEGSAATAPTSEVLMAEWSLVLWLFLWLILPGGYLWWIVLATGCPWYLREMQVRDHNFGTWNLMFLMEEYWTVPPLQLMHVWIWLILCVLLVCSWL